MAGKKGTIKKSNLGGMAWAKNVGKSLGFSAMDIITEMMPATMENISVNKNTVEELYQTMRNSLRGKSTRRLDEMLTGAAAENYKTAKTALKNAMEDLKTGNLYNKERMESSFDDGFDIDMDFDFSDDLSDSNFDSSSESSGPTVAIPDINITSNIDKNNPMVKAVEAQSQVLLDTTEATMKQNLTISRANMALSENMHRQLMGGIQTINDNLSLLVNFQSMNMTKYIAASMKYFDDNMKLMTDMFETYKKLNVPEEKPEQSNSGLGVDDILTYSGGFDLSNYAQLVKKQIGDAMDSNLITSSIKMMFSDTDTLATMATQPLKFIADGIVKKFIPNFLKESLSSFDKSLSSFIPAMLWKITGLRDNANPLLDLVGKIFGLNVKNKKTIDTSLYEKGKVPFDGITRKSIVEVIPGYLSKIYSALSGKEELAYNFEKGKFNTVSNLKKEFIDDERRTVLGSYEGLSEIKDNLNAFKYRNEKDREDLIKRMEDMFMKITDREGLVNPYKRKDGTDDLQSLFDGTSKELEMVRAAILAMPKHEQQKIFGRDAISARQARTKLLTELEENPGSLGAVMFNDLFSKDNELTANNPLLKSYGDSSKTKRASIFNPTDGYGNTSTDYLRDIKKILLEGINVFIKRGDASPDIQSRLDEMNSETLVRGLRTEHNSYRNDVSQDQIERDAERGIINIGGAEDLPDDPAVIAEQVKNYARIRDERARGQNQQGFGINIGKFLSGKVQDKFNAVREFITNALSVPANAVKKFFDKINDSMYDLVFGKQEGTEAGQSFFSAVLGNVKRSFGNFFGFLKTKIYEPMHESLFGKDGLITKIKESDQWKMLKEKASQFGKYLFGAKNAEGIREGGLFSNTANEMGDMFKSFKYYFTGKGYKNSKGEEFGDNENSVFGNVKNMFSSFKNTMKEYFFGNENVKEKGKGVLSGIGSSIKQGFQNFADAIFGPKMIGGKKNKKYVDMEKLGKTMKEHAPKALAHGMVGAGVGIMASMGGLGILGTLIGGPIGGAAIGIAGSFLSKSEKLKNWLFGEKDDNGERVGGFINKSTQKFFKDNKTGLIGGATVGALKGMLGIGILPSFILGGPLSGAVMGMATQFLFKSEKMQKMLFGEKQKDGSRVGGFINKLMNRTTDKDAKKRLGNIGAGALGGLGLGFITSHMGLLGALSLGPIGGAVAGAAAGIALSSDKWRKYLFGEFDEETGKRKGGLLTKFSNFMKVEVFQALKVKLLDWKFNIQDWFSEKIAEPFLDSLAPFKEEFSRFGKRIRKTLNNIVDSIKNSKLFKGIQTHLIDPILDGFDKYLFQPFKKISNALIKGTGKVIGTVVSAPFTMLNKIADKLSDRHRKEGIRSVRRAALENIKNSEFVVGLKEFFQPVKEGIDTVIDYTKAGIKGVFGFTKKIIKQALGLLGKGVLATIKAPFQLMALPFKGAKAISNFIKGRRNPNVKDGDRLDGIYSGERSGFLQGVGDYLSTFNPFSKVRHDAQYYKLDRNTIEERVLRNNDRFEQDSRGRWRDKETGKYVKRSLLNKMTDNTMLDFDSGAFYEDERTQKRNERAEERARKKKQRDELREDMHNQLDLNRQLARAMGYDSFDEDGKYVGAIYKDIDKQFEAQYGKDFKNKSRMERDAFKADQLSKINEAAIKENTGNTVTELQNLTKLMEKYLDKEKNGESHDLDSDNSEAGDVTSGIKKGARYAKNKAGKWYDTLTGKFVKKELAEGKSKSADDPKNNPDNPDQQHEDGLDEVPFDGYKATLHKGEAVVPKKGVKIMDKVKNVGRSAASFMKSFSDSIGSVFSKSLAAEDARDDAEEAAKAELAEDQKKLEEKHSFTSRKTAAFLNAEKEKLMEKEEERSFRSRVLEYLSQGVSTAKEQAKGFFDVFGLKNGLITLGIAAALPWLIKFFKDPIGSLQGLAGSIKKAFNEWTGNTDEDGDRTNESGDTQTNDDMKEGMANGVRSLINKFIVKPTRKVANWFINKKTLKNTAKELYQDADGTWRRADGSKASKDEIKQRKKLDKQEQRKSDKQAKKDANKNKDVSSNIDEVTDDAVKNADETADSVKVSSKVDDIELTETKNKKGETIYKRTDGSIASNAEIDNYKSKNAKGVRVSSKADDVAEGVAKNLDDVGEAVVRNADEVANANLIKKFINFAKTKLSKFGDDIVELIARAGKKVKVDKFAKIIKELGGALTEKLLKSQVGRIAVGFAKVAGSTATFLLSDAFAMGYGAVSGGTAMETANLFGVRSEDATGAMKATSAIMKAILNFSWAFVLDILMDIVYAVSGINVRQWLAETIYSAFVGDEEVEKLKVNQEKFDKDYNKYLKIQAEMNPDNYEKDENGNIKLDADGKPIRVDGKSVESKDSYNDRVNKTWWSKTTQNLKTGWKHTTGYLFGQKGDEEQYKKDKEMKKRLDDMLKEDPSLKDDPSFKQSYSDVLRSIDENKTQKSVFGKLIDKGKSGLSKLGSALGIGKAKPEDISKGTDTLVKETSILGAKIKTIGVSSAKDMKSTGKQFDTIFNKNFAKYYTKPLDELNKTVEKSGKEFKKNVNKETKTYASIFNNGPNGSFLSPWGGGIGGSANEKVRDIPTKRLPITEDFESYSMKDKVFVDEYGMEHGIGGQAEMDLLKSYVVTSDYRTAHRPNHTGIDLSKGNNSPIYSFVAGKVTKAVSGYPKDSGSTTNSHSNDGGGYGNHVQVTDKFGNTHLYGHLNAVSVKQGQEIPAGYQVGDQGHTGYSTGSHLHYEIRTDWSKGKSAAVNPTTFLRNYNGVSNMVLQDATSSTGVDGETQQQYTGLAGIASVLNSQLSPLTDGLGKLTSEFNTILAPLLGNNPTNPNTITADEINIDGHNISATLDDTLMSEIIKKTFEITNGAEGSYDTVVANDNGSWSVGIAGFHGDAKIRPLFTEMANNLSGAAKVQAQRYATWGGRILTSSEKAEVERFLRNNHNVSKPIQDAHLSNIIKNNIAVPVSMYDSGILKDYRSIILAGDIGNTGPAHLSDWKEKYKPVTSGSDLYHVKSSLQSTDSWWGRQANDARNGKYYNGWMNRIGKTYDVLKNWYADGYEDTYQVTPPTAQELKQSLEKTFTLANMSPKNIFGLGRGGDSLTVANQDKDIFTDAMKSGEMSYDNNKIIINNKPSNIPEGIWDKIIEVLTLIATNTGKTNDSIKDIATINNNTQINATQTPNNKSKNQSTNPMYDVANKRRSEVTSSGYKTAKLIAQGVN